MKKYMSCTVKIAPISSSEVARVLYYESRKAVDEIPENYNKIIRWVDYFENFGVNFDTGEYNPEALDTYFDLDFGARIEYDPMYNTGFIKYMHIADFRSELMLKRENYFMTVEYKEVFPTLEDLKNVPLDEVVEYIKYIYNKEEA